MTIFKNSFIALCTMLVAVALVFTSCNNENEDDKLRVTLPDAPVTAYFDYGQTHSFTVKMEKERSYEIEQVPDGWTAQLESKTKLNVTAPKSGGATSGVVKISVHRKERTVSAQLKVELLPATTIATNANSYIISEPNTRYKIKATVKGNTSQKIDGTPASAVLVWQTSKNLLGTVMLDGDHISFVTTADADDATKINEGNALVAVKDADDNTLWSWHLWLTDYNPEIDNVTNTDGSVMMDRNLGAKGVGSEDIYEAYGLFYQWGRKEPFLPSPAEYVAMPTHSYDENYDLTETEEEYNRIQAEIEANRIKVNINNPQTGDGEYEWEYVGYPAPVALNAPGNITYAVEHPTTFLGCRTDIAIGEYVFDWYMQQDLMNTSGVMMQSDSQLWGDAEKGTEYKTIFDPCPPGYCVPPRGAFGEIPVEYACSYVSDEWTKEEYGWRWTGGNGDFFPAVGNYDVSGLMGETSERMLYWTAESFGTSGFGKAATLFVAFNDVYYGIYPLLDETVASSWYSYGARAYGASVRCVREQNNIK